MIHINLQYILISELFFFCRSGSTLIPNILTNSPLPLLCCRQVEDVCLVARVWFVVGLNVNRELLDKGTGVSEGREATK